MVGDLLGGGNASDIVQVQTKTPTHEVEDLSPGGGLPMPEEPRATPVLRH